jgi:hypothetical protein
VLYSDVHVCRQQIQCALLSLFFFISLLELFDAACSPPTRAKREKLLALFHPLPPHLIWFLSADRLLPAPLSSPPPHLYSLLLILLFRGMGYWNTHANEGFLLSSPPSLAFLASDPAFKKINKLLPHTLLSIHLWCVLSLYIYIHIYIQVSTLIFVSAFFEVSLTFSSRLTREAALSFVSPSICFPVVVFVVVVAYLPACWSVHRVEPA